MLVQLLILNATSHHFPFEITITSNRYSIGQHTEGLSYNPDDSLDIYIHNTNPGTDKESN
jgi:hypothetical protein